MLNPNEIANKRFDKVMGQKYRADDVDNYLAQVADSMNDLLEEKQELEKKLIVLADKLEEYKDDEESLRSALLGAQKLGDSVVRDAKAKARDILEDAEAVSYTHLDVYKRQKTRRSRRCAPPFQRSFTACRRPRRPWRASMFTALWLLSRVRTATAGRMWACRMGF